MRKKTWIYLPETDELLEKRPYNWALAFQLNAPVSYTVFADTPEEARAIVDRELAK